MDRPINKACVFNLHCWASSTVPCKLCVVMKQSSSGGMHPVAAQCLFVEDDNNHGDNNHHLE